MRVFRKTICISFAVALLTGASAVGASANEELMKLASDAKNWAMPTGDYANTRYSKLNQINKDNVKNLQVKWTFSTGVLRGHEGGPLVIGDTSYDMAMACAAGATAIGAGWGYHSREALRAAGAHHIADHPLHILDYLKVLS